MKKVCLLLISFWMSTGQAAEVSILYTNDIESVYEPVEAHWHDDTRLIGGMAHLSTLIREQRAARDSGRAALQRAGVLRGARASRVDGRP